MSGSDLFSFDSVSASLIRNMPLALVIIDAKAKIHFFNPQFLEMFGSQAGDKSRTLGELVEAGALHNFLEELSSLVKGHQDNMEITCRYHSATGQSERWMHVQTAPLPPEIETASSDRYFYAVIDDVTNNIDETERILREKELAIQATRSKSSFLATMSHEIRTPIHTVTGMTELLLDTPLDDEQQEYIKQIRFSAEILLSLINDILDLSKIEAGRLNLEIIDFDLIRTIDESIDMQSLAAFSKGLELNLSCDPDVPRLVRGDPIRIRQIITNLLSNALKFTSQGEIVVSISVISRETSRSRVRFAVTDTGIGIAADKTTLLFQAFTQVDSSMTRRFGGTGLGLSICKSLIGMMDGSIGVESQEGIGSTFWCEIPFELVGEPASAQFAIGPLLSNLKILVIDDVRTSRQVIHSILKDFQVEIYDAENALIALDLLRKAAITKSPFNLALVDLEMPGMDGWQLASEVNADRSINGTRLFLMVPPGKMGGEAKMKLLKWFDDYVQKPIKRHEFLSVLERSLQTSLDLGLADDETMMETTGSQLEVSPSNNRSAEVIDLALPQSPPLILVAEDHFVNQKLFETILVRLGYRVVLAADGRQALDLGLSRKPDLVFMDVQMPEMNGYEATQALRQAGYQAPVIAVTANALKGDLEKCLQVGMNDYLSKPFQKTDIEAMLIEWLPGNQPTKAKYLTTVPESVEQTILDHRLGAELFISSLDNGVFDFQKALNVFLGDRETLLMVLSDYIKRTVVQIDTIASCLYGGDHKTAGLHAHTIKGSSWNLGITRLGSAAELLENACKRQDLPEAIKIIPDLRAEWDNFIKASSKHLGG